MSLNLEKILDELIIKKNPDTKIVDSPGDSQWGQLIIPKNDHQKQSEKDTLRILLIASYKTGGILLKTLLKIQQLFPGKTEVVGFVTDDPVSDKAKISVKRRIWRKYNDVQRLKLEDDIIDIAVKAGIPSFTGDIKTDFGHNLVEKLKPDAILVCVFGQIIDSPVINDPPLGIYNFHPADLANHHGAGPQPYQDLVNRNASVSKFTIHKLTEQLDAGDVIGQSPEICVTTKKGKLPENLLLIEDRLFIVIDYMASVLVYKLYEQKLKKLMGPIDEIDFCSYFSDNMRNKLLLPITKTTTDTFIRELTDDSIMLIKKLWENENSV